MAFSSNDTCAGDRQSIEPAQDRDRDAMTRFDSFYDFAFPRVYAYAQRRMDDDAQAKVLCRLVLIRAVSSLGGIEAVDHRVERDPADLAFWLFCLARRTADGLRARIAENPALLEGIDLDGCFENQTLEMLRDSRAVSVSGDPRATAAGERPLVERRPESS